MFPWNIAGRKFSSRKEREKKGKIKKNKTNLLPDITPRSIDRTDRGCSHSHASRDILNYGRDKETGSKSSPFIPRKFSVTQSSLRRAEDRESRGVAATVRPRVEVNTEVPFFFFFSFFSSLAARASRICCTPRINYRIILSTAALHAGFQWQGEQVESGEDHRFASSGPTRKSRTAFLSRFRGD